MTPVISPWVFYLMPLCDRLGFVTSLFGSIAIIGSIILVVCIVVECTSYRPDESFIKAAKPIQKKLAVFGVVLILISMLTPTEKTLTKMIVAQNVTYERVETVTDAVETVYNDIMGLFDDGEA